MRKHKGPASHPSVAKHVPKVVRRTRVHNAKKGPKKAMKGHMSTLAGEKI